MKTETAASVVLDETPHRSPRIQRMSGKQSAKKNQMRVLLHRLVADFSDTRCYGPDGESKHREIVRLFDSIDWGLMPGTLIMELFDFLIARLPVSVLIRSPYSGERSFLGYLKDHLTTNEEILRDIEVEAKVA